MAPKRRNLRRDTSDPMPTTQAELNQLLEERISQAIAQYEANRNEHSGGSGGTGGQGQGGTSGGNTTNGNRKCFYNNLNVTSPILIVRSHVCRLYNMSVQRFRVHVQTISRLQASQL